MDWRLKLSDLGHIQNEFCLLKTNHRSDKQSRGSARGGKRDWRHEESCALLEVWKWGSSERNASKSEIAGWKQKAVY
jgi:hypothetical protein